MKTLTRLLLCLMLCAQFATLVHAYEHEAMHAEEEHCVTCQLHSDVKFALVKASHTNHHFDARSIVDTQISGQIPNYLFQLHHNRSPPLLLK